MGNGQTKEYITPGVYGLEKPSLSNTDAYANYTLTVLLTPSEFKWRIGGYETLWRDNGSSVLLARDRYVIQFSKDPYTSIGFANYLLDEDSLLIIRGEQ